jgi:hypothetical protein
MKRQTLIALLCMTVCMTGSLHSAERVVICETLYSET